MIIGDVINEIDTEVTINTSECNKTLSMPSSRLTQELNRELRHLPSNHRSKLAEILDVAGSWKKLASILPKPDNKIGLLFSNATIYQLERQLLAGKSPTMELINSWSTCGRHRPTIKTLLIYLEKAQMQRAKDYVHRYILDLPPIDEQAQQNTIQISDLSSYNQESRCEISSSSVISNTSSFEMIASEDLHSNSILTDRSDNLISFTSRGEHQDYSNDYLQTNLEHMSDISANSNYNVEEIFAFDGFSDFTLNIGSKCQKYSFESIYRSTNKFCHKPYNSIAKTGTMLGEGRFSRVFKAFVEPIDSGRFKECAKEPVAVKLLKKDSNKHSLLNEIDLIVKISHENILKFLGISTATNCNGIDQYYLCLVYEFMENGSLLDRLACRDNSRPINWKQRLSIAVGIAKGITYLHTAFENPIIHRDIKSANILLDAQLNPRVGDFTLIRQLEAYVASNNLIDSQEAEPDKYIQTQISQMTQNIMGTSIYMAAEAFRGDISTKLDTFSYGVVLLEIITGMKPYDESRQEDIFTYITEEITDIDEQIESQCINNQTSINKLDVRFSGTEENENPSNNLRVLQEKGRDDFLERILDQKAGDWDFTVAKSMFRVALLSTENKKKIRPKMTQVLPMLEGLQLSIIHDKASKIYRTSQNELN